jgi:4a-hydroxytetrahydrobiopterin dehydratase
MNKLTNAEITLALSPLTAWSLQGGKLHREYKFPSFRSALDFMVAAAPGIDKMDHHPEWANVYNRVTVDLTTHSAGGITQKDFELAALLESMSTQFS